MGEVSVSTILLCVLICAQLIVSGQAYAQNQDKLGITSLGYEVLLMKYHGNFLKANGSTSLDMDPMHYIITNKTINASQSDGKDSPQVIDDDGAQSIFLAGYMTSLSSYYGLEVTTDVYGISLLDKKQTSGIVVSLNYIGDYTLPNYNSAVFGWHVQPRLYGDSHVHFYVYWTTDGFHKTGCFNLDCPGYVPEVGTSIMPGIPIKSVSEPDGTKHTIIFKILKDGGGDWLLHFGFDSEPHLVGRFPGYLFNNLRYKADAIKIVGYAVTPKRHLIPMGSGYLSNSRKAASFSHIQFIDQSGHASKIPQDTPSMVTDPNIYSISPISPEGKFTYGGPRK